MTDPDQIEAKSFQIIENGLVAHARGVNNFWTPAEREVVKRVIHTTADPEIAGLLDFHPRTVAAGIIAIREGVRIVTDSGCRSSGLGINRLYVSGIPYIRTAGPRGGSPIAAAIVIALCKLAEVQV